MEFSFARYLHSKRTVDDRSLNRHVLDALKAELGRHEDLLRVVELGGGVGTMIERAIEWELFSKSSYQVVDICAELLDVGKVRLREFAKKRNLSVDSRGDGLLISGTNLHFEVDFAAAELTEFAAASTSAAADLLIGCAVLDLVDVQDVLPKVWKLLAPQALFWFSINFDGETIFLPELELDQQVLDLYHRSMDLRLCHGKRVGDSKTGRHLFGHLAQSGATVIASGASDWVVHPVSGTYPDDEAYFLHHIIHTIALELANHPEIEQEALEQWVALRHAQIEQAELVYIAHQLDFLGRAP